MNIQKRMEILSQEDIDELLGIKDSEECGNEDHSIDEKYVSTRNEKNKSILVRDIFVYDNTTGYSISPYTLKEKERYKERVKEHYSKYNLGGGRLRKAIFRTDSRGIVYKIDYLE